MGIPCHFSLPDIPGMFKKKAAPFPEQPEVTLLNVFL
jgi:hypothetical protein